MKRLTLLLASLIAAGCAAATPPVPAAQGVSVSASALGPVPAGLASKKLKHVVIVVQENRTFDNFFYGFKGAHYATSGKTSNGATVALHQVDLKGPEILKGWKDALRDYDG